MASNLSFSLLLLLLLFHCAATATTTTSPPQQTHHHSTITPPPTPLQPRQTNHSITTTPPPSPRQTLQLNNIVDALIGAGDFSNWAGILSVADPSLIPISATLFIPSDDEGDYFSKPLSPLLLFAYHIIPQRLSFTDLRLFSTNSRLPTLLPGFSLLVTNNSRSNFTLDGSAITHPDLYINAAIAVHGVAAPFDYTVYGDMGGIECRNNGSLQHQPPPSLPVGEVRGRKSEAAKCLCLDFSIFVLLIAFCFLWVSRFRPTFAAH